MSATVERRHREAAALVLKTGTQFGASELEWIDCGGGSVAPSWIRVAQALATVEASAQGEAGRVELRASVRWFAEQMELELRKNDHKGGWHRDKPLDLVARIENEAIELFDALDVEDEEGVSAAPDPACAVSEAADVANMAMMVADHFREGGPSRDQGHTLLAPPPKGSL